VFVCCLEHYGVADPTRATGVFLLSLLQTTFLHPIPERFAFAALYSSPSMHHFVVLIVSTAML